MDSGLDTRSVASGRRMDRTPAACDSSIQERMIHMAATRYAQIRIVVLRTQSPKVTAAQAAMNRSAPLALAYQSGPLRKRLLRCSRTAITGALATTEGTRSA